LKVQTNVVFEHLHNSDKKIIVEQGGTRSGKTYNIVSWIIFDYCTQHSGKIITICRKTFPALRASVMRDFMDILKENDLYNEANHNKSSSEYHLFGNLVEFIGLDMPVKLRGRKRDLLFINEANELYWEDFQQLLFRTDGRVILDYNPSDEFHWIYDKVLTRDDCDFYQTSYKDNPFLSQDIINEIERLKITDNHRWRIFGLGERGQSRSLVFQHQECEEVKGKFLAYGMDFGFSNDETTLVATYIDGIDIYFKELLYRTGMTNQDIAKEFSVLGLDRRDEIFADSAEPKSIEEIHRMGWNIKSVIKGEINLGIDMMRRYRINLTKDSTNMIKEFRSYKYIEDKNGKLTNKPEDRNNHLIDACRYSIVNKLSKPNYGKYAIR